MGLCRYCMRQTLAVNSPHCEYHRGLIHKLRKRAVKDGKYMVLRDALDDLEVSFRLFYYSEYLLEVTFPSGLKDIDWNEVEDMVDYFANTLE